MKKFAVVLIIILSLATIFSTVTFAAELPIKVMVNDSKLSFPDAQPFIDANGRTQTPAKFIGEALGATVTWDGREQKAVFILEDKELVLYIGKKDYMVDGQTKQMDTTAILKDGRTFVPAKYIAEAFGATVNWNGTAKTVYIRNYIQPEEGKDVADGTLVTNQDNFIETLKIATYTLQPKVVLKCYNYADSEYGIRDLDLLYGVSNINTSAWTSNDLTQITLTLNYSQAYKIQQAGSNKLALSRLSDEDTDVMDKLDEIINQVIKNGMTDYEKELAIHDYLVLNSKYDYDNYENDTIPDQSYEPYGLLIDGIGVCKAYAESMQLLLNKAGIECEVVTGRSKGENHAWNIVKLDDEYYMLDATWDDPVPDKQGRISHNYFNVTSDQLLQDHTWDSNKWPSANGTKYNYYVYNNLVVNSYSEFKKFVINEINEGKLEILVYVNNYDKNEYDLDFIFDYYRPSFSYSVQSDATNTPITIILD